MNKYCYQKITLLHLSFPNDNTLFLLHEIDSSKNEMVVTMITVNLRICDRDSFPISTMHHA